MPKVPDLHYAIGLEPKEALRYLAGQTDYHPAFNWYDVWQDAHAKAFTVAKAMQVDLLKDIHSAVQNGMKNGLTVSQFRKTIEPTLQAKGWWGKKIMTNPDTGKEQVVQLGSPRRLELIYRANMSVAESAARYQDFVESAPERPYWQFVCVLDAHTRPSHRALNGKVFRWDDPFWNTFWPPLDWGCRCTVRKLTAEQVRKLGLKVESSVGKIAYNQPGAELQKIGAQRSTYTDPVTGEKVSTGAGWDYNPGQAWYLDAQTWQKAEDLPDPLRRTFLADMAKNNLAAEMWPTWVDGILARNSTNGFAATIGWMKPVVFDKLTALNLKPESPLIIANDKGILHAQRPAKQKSGQAISIEELKKLPGYISDYEAVLYDKINKNILYVVKSAEVKATKIVIEVNYNLREMQTPANLFKTVSDVNAYNLAEDRYVLLDGKLK
ncbi:MAG: phage minor head protein [Elusimicrobia bacterium]|nr:phage minor head protein [Elusimicrobiota bacterium]